MTLMAAYLNQSATYYAVTGAGNDAENTYDAGTAVQVRFIAKSGTIDGPDGNVIRYDGVVYLDAAQTVMESGRFVVGSNTYRVLSVSTPRTLDGTVDHHKCLVTLEAV